MHPALLALQLGLLATYSSAIISPLNDWRFLSNGNLMLEDLYLDQPQCALYTPPSPSPVRWVCTIARNSQPEGHFGEHSEILYSDDSGVTWVTGIRLEPPGVPTNSYGNILVTDFGRLIVLYNMNLHNITHFPNGSPFTRDDELGFMVWRYSDDGGATWSQDRYTVPLRNTSVDRSNTFNGATQIFWSVDQIKRTRTGGSLHAYTKIGTYMQSAPEESFFILSNNVNTETNASLVAWDLYPQGDVGVRPPGPPGGMQWEEAHVVQLATQPGMFTVCRTSTGYLGAAFTLDDSGAGGWSEGHFATFSSKGLPAASGRWVKNPEGPITLKRFSNGLYLLLFYFNSVPGYSPKNSTRNARNPYWLAVGWEEGDGEVHFSQPEVVLHYSPLAFGTGTGPGYPDFIEDKEGRVFITETNKTQARVHPIDPDFLALLFSAATINATATQCLALAFPPGGSQGTSFPTPKLPDFTGPSPTGATLGLWLSGHSAAPPNSTLIDVGGPLRLSVGAEGGALELTLTDAATGTSATLTTDVDCTERLLQGGSDPHYVAVVVDAAARILTWSVDGVVCDGGQGGDGGGGVYWGWEWVPSAMSNLNANPAAPTFVLGKGYGGRILGGGWYGRALMHTELVGNYRAGIA